MLCIVFQRKSVHSANKPTSISASKPRDIPLLQPSCALPLASKGLVGSLITLNPPQAGFAHFSQVFHLVTRSSVTLPCHPSLLHVWSGWAAKELGQALHSPLCQQIFWSSSLPRSRVVWPGLLIIAGRDQQGNSRDHCTSSSSSKTLLTPPCLAMLTVPASRMAKAQKIHAVLCCSVIPLSR